MKNHGLFPIFICFLMSLFTNYSHSRESSTFSVESGTKKVALLELYSSEGCSSCPPADRWFAALKTNSELWKSFVPIGFHVDYWNYLGWVDRFSHTQFTGRQRALARSWGSRRVYTPGFVKNGKEWKQRSLRGLKGGEIGNLRVSSSDKKHFQVRFSPSIQKKGSYQVHWVLMGHGLQTQVKAGENTGETLRHEFTVLGKKSKKMKSTNGVFQVEVDLPKNAQAKPKSYSVAFWVTKEGDLEPLQSIGGYL